MPESVAACDPSRAPETVPAMGWAAVVVSGSILAMAGKIARLQRTRRDERNEVRPNITNTRAKLAQSTQSQGADLFRNCRSAALAHEKANRKNIAPVVS